MTAHSEYVAKKVTGKMNILKCLSGAEWGSDTNTLMRYVNTCIRPAIEYGCQVINSVHPNNAGVQKLERLLLAAIKIAMGVPKHTENNVIRTEAGAMPIIFRSQQAGMYALAKVMLDTRPHPLHTPINSLIASNANTYWKHGINNSLNTLNWLENTTSQLREIDGLVEKITCHNLEAEYLKPIGAPYRHNTSFVIKNLDRKKSEHSAIELVKLRSTFEEDIATRSTGCKLTIYTDASVKLETGEAAYAVLPFIDGARTESHVILRKLLGGHGSMTTELAAIRDAIILVGRVCKPGENFIICTDSMSGIQAIINPDIKDNRDTLSSIHNELDILDSSQITGTIMWVPSHIGISGNEAVDTLANVALISEAEGISIRPTKSMVKQLIKRHVKDKWHRGMSYSHRTYGILNPNKCPMKIPNCHRHIQNKIIRLRVNGYNKCPWQCEKICSLCQTDIFTTAHYLIECPVTMNNNNKVLQLLEPGDFSLPVEDQAAIILRKSDNKEYNSLIELINKHPPASYCEQHP